MSFYRNKAVHLKDGAHPLLRDYGGQVPTTMEQLLTLPGVGRKTANLTLIVACRSRDNICVDTHVHRIANRFGWVRTSTPEETEQALYAATRRALVAHGQPVPGYMGSKYLPPGVPSLWRLCHRGRLSSPRRLEGSDTREKE